VSAQDTTQNDWMQTIGSFNPLDPAFRLDPYPVYRRMLKEQPVYLTPFGVYTFARYDDCLAILRDHRRWSSDEGRSPNYESERHAFRAMLGPDAELIDDRDRPFLFLDPPDHTRLRRLVNLAFTPRAVEALRPRIQKIVDSLLDTLAGAGNMDVIADLAYPLPVIVICEMLGVPPEDQATFKVWSAELARSLEPTITLPPESMRRRVHASKESRDYFRGLVADRRKHLGSDILSALIAAEEEGDKLSEEELLSTCTLLLVAGHETTVNLIGNAMLQLVRHADQLEMLRAQPSLVSGAVEEVLRYDPPVQFDRRLALEDIEIGGVRVAEGQFVILLLGAANRDPAHFPDPDRFDITRNDDRHLSFGQGIHYCLGAPLARMEGAVALGTLTRRFRDFEITTDSLKYKEQIIIRGLESLPIRFKVA